MSDQIDTLVNGLPVQQSDFDAVETALQIDSSDDESVPTEPRRIIPPRPYTVVRWVVTAGALALAFACGANRGSNTESAVAAEPKAVTPTVTVTVTKQTYPKVCLKAMTDIQRYLDNAAKIASISGKQLDILDASYSAILMRDTKKLNILADSQRQLAGSIAAPNAELLPDMDLIHQEIKQCQSQL